MNKIIIGHKTWTETPAMILEKMNERFPNIQVFYQIGRGSLSHLVQPKEAYRLGVVFPLISKEGRRETMVYYPIKDIYIHYFYQIPNMPVNKYEDIAMQTKRGFLRVACLNKRPVISFEEVYSRVE